MELALQELSISTATKPITVDYDPYKIFQVHDYKNISFLRQSPQVKAASTETIKVFAMAYPELLKEKFFINGFVWPVSNLRAAYANCAVVCYLPSPRPPIRWRGDT